MIPTETPFPKQARRRTLPCRHLLSCFLGARMPRGLRRKGSQGPGRHRAGPATLPGRAEGRGHRCRLQNECASGKCRHAALWARGATAWRGPPREALRRGEGLGAPGLPPHTHSRPLQRRLRGTLPLDSLALPAASILGTTCPAPLLLDGRSSSGTETVKGLAFAENLPHACRSCPPAVAASGALSSPLFCGDKTGPRK